MYEEDMMRRIAKLEDADTEMNKALTQLIISTTTMSEALSRLSEIAPRVTKLEVEMSNNKVISGAAKWLAGTFTASLIVMALSYLFRGGI